MFECPCCSPKKRKYPENIQESVQIVYRIAIASLVAVCDGHSATLVLPGATVAEHGLEDVAVSRQDHLVSRELFSVTDDPEVRGFGVVSQCGHGALEGVGALPIEVFFKVHHVAMALLGTGALPIEASFIVHHRRGMSRLTVDPCRYGYSINTSF